MKNLEILDRKRNRKNRIYEYGMKDNFWGPAGDTGPCGPCTEIIYDFGAEYGCKEGCGP
jgi:alanyl-tRNA synthetase